MTLFDFFRGTKETKEEAPAERKQASYLIDFSTHNVSRDNQIQLVAPKYAMDGADSGVGDAIKAAFNVAQSRVPGAIMGWYGSQSFIGYAQCALIAQQWLVNKACIVPAEDAARAGWKVAFNDDTQIDDIAVQKAIEKLDTHYRIVEQCRELTQMKRVFGLRVAIFKVKSDDPEYYEKPFNIDGVRAYSYEGIAQVDPYWMTPELTTDAVSDPADINFYEPEYWVIAGKRYHRSHMVVLRHAPVPDILKPAYLYGGVSLCQQIYERAYAAERTANEAPQLTMTKRMNVIKTNLNGLVSNPDKFVRAKQLQTDFRDNYGTMLIGEEEEYQQHETTLSDLDSVIMTQYQLVAAVAGVPATRLLGTSPKGFNATGEHEIKTYHEMLAGIQENDFQPLLERHYQLMMRSEIEPELGVKLHPTVVFNPLDEPTEAELAQVQKLKADTYSVLQQTGAITAQEIAEALVKDERSGFESIDPEDVEEPPDGEDFNTEEEPDTWAPADKGQPDSNA